MRIRSNVFGRLLLILVVIFFSYQLLTKPQPWIFVDNVNLLFHEGGHLIFRPFGQFIGILGGSLTQILIPILFFTYFFLKGEFFSSYSILFWIADNIINVSVYMMDAVNMQLPLLGGDASIHDWNWLFSQLGLIYQAEFIGKTFFILGIFLIAVSIGGMVVLTLKEIRNDVITLQAHS